MNQPMSLMRYAAGFVRKQDARRSAAAAVICIALTTGNAWSDGRKSWGEATVEEFDEFTVFIEICGTDEDAGIKGLLGGEPWTRATVSGPDGRAIYQFGPKLGDVGSGTVFWESAEPSFVNLPLDEFLDRFPDMSVSVARSRCEQVNAQYVKGANPAEERRQKKAVIASEPTFGKLWELYKAAYEAGATKGREYQFSQTTKGQKRIVRFNAPGDIKGMGFLAEGRDTMYVYPPDMKKIRRMGTHIKAQSVLGSDLTNDDMSEGSGLSSLYKPTLVGTAITGRSTSPPMTLGNAHSIPATATIALASPRISRCASSRCSPATPQSVSRSTRLPSASATTAASSATGRSAVPAAATTMSPTPSTASGRTTSSRASGW